MVDVPVAIDWMLGLTAGLRSCHPADRCLRLAEQIAATWGDRGRWLRELDELLHDRRGQNGLPFDLSTSVEDRMTRV